MTMLRRHVSLPQTSACVDHVAVISNRLERRQDLCVLSVVISLANRMMRELDLSLLQPSPILGRSSVGPSSMGRFSSDKVSLTGWNLSPMFVYLFSYSAFTHRKRTRCQDTMREASVTVIGPENDHPQQCPHSIIVFPTNSSSNHPPAKTMQNVE